ncbi:MAG: integrase [Rhodospirillales bacterium]|nr:integrase [Rhodospirillales bacterium]
MVTVDPEQNAGFSPAVARPTSVQGRVVLTPHQIDSFNREGFLSIPSVSAPAEIGWLAKGDALVVTRIDRLARSIGDLQDIVRALKAKGATLKATEQPIDTSTAAGKAFLDMLGVFAEFETNLRRERQLEGIAKAKKAGVYKGRKPSIPADEIKALKADGLGATEIAKQLGIGRASVYRILGMAPTSKRDRASAAVSVA